MHTSITGVGRRQAVRMIAAAAVAAPVARAVGAAGRGREAPMKISLAQWSLHRALFAKELDPLEFPAAAKREYGIDAVEYVNTFYKGKERDAAYIGELKKRCTELGVTSLLVMCDGIGALGDPDEGARRKAVEGHRPWLDMAKELGCHSVRVNAESRGEREEQSRLAADGLRRLTELAAPMGLNVIVENHGGLSSDGAWLAATIRRVDHPNCGTLPDFGNFIIAPGRVYDRYTGVAELMPYAKAVSAKSHDFDAEGNEIHTDYRRMLGIVHEAGYRGYVGIEYEGTKLSEPEGIRATKRLLERELARLT